MPSSLRSLALRFPSAHTEAAFQEDYYRRSLPLVRASLVIGLAQIALFGLLDRAMVPLAYREIWSVRAAMCVGVVFCIGVTFAPWFRRRWQAATSVAPLIAGLGVVAMSVIGQEASALYDYYGGVMIVLVYVHVLLRLRFVVASTVGGALIASYVCASAAVGMSGLLLVNGVFYLASTQATGMVASYALERYARREFAHARTLGRSNDGLAAALRQLRAAQDRLVQQEKLAGLGRLTQGVAHELRNPLNFVTNFADLLVELADELAAAAEAGDREATVGIAGEVAENARCIATHGRRAEAVVVRMHAHAGEPSAGRRAVDLNGLAAEHARQALGTRGAGLAGALALHLDPAVGDVEMNPDEAAAVVRALVENACDAVRERAAVAEAGAEPFEPAVRVATRRVGGQVGLVVADNGPGLGADVHGRLFEPFFTTKPPGQGVGLGLSLARTVVHAHGGELRAEGAGAEGATFTVTLPAPAV